MEGSGFILLSYILLIYITAKTTDECKFQEISHKDTRKRFAKTMTKYPFLQPQHVFMGSASQPSIRTLPHTQGQGDRIDRDVWDPTDILSKHTPGLNNSYCQRTRILNPGLTTGFSRIEDIGHSGLIDQSFFQAPFTAGSLVPDYSILGPTGYNPSDNPSHISNVRRTAQILASTNNIGHPTIFTPHNYLAPATSNYKAPDISDNASHISNVHRTAQTLASTNGLWGPTISTSPHAPSPHGPSDISSPVPSAAQIGEDNIAQPSYTSRRVPELNVPSIDGPSGSLIPCSHVPEPSFPSIDGPSGSLIPCSHIPEPSFPSSIHPSGTCDPSQLVIDMTKFKSPDPLGSLVPCSLVPDTTRPNGPEPADISNNKDTAIDPIDQFTKINDEDPYMEFCYGGNNTGQSVEEDALEVLQPWRIYQQRNRLGPESVNNSHAPDASEPYAGEDNRPQPGKDTGSVIPQTRREYRNRQKSNVLPEELKRCRNKKGRKAKGPNSRPCSSAIRRRKPGSRYFCIDSSCQSSQEKGATGFPNLQEMARHLANHETPKYLCSLPHAHDKQSLFSRKDGLRL